MTDCAGIDGYREGWFAAIFTGKWKIGVYSSIS